MSSNDTLVYVDSITPITLNYPTFEVAPLTNELHVHPSTRTVSGTAYEGGNPARPVRFDLPLDAIDPMHRHEIERAIDSIS